MKNLIKFNVPFNFPFKEIRKLKKKEEDVHQPTNYVQPENLIKRLTEKFIRS